jgi:cytidyltransferase-like protein
MPSKRYKNLYIIGVFDLFHTGHLSFLEQCATLSENLIVAVNGDEMVAAYKRLPIFSEEQRLKLIKANRLVSDAFIIREFDNKPYLEQYEIDAIVHGDDWERSSYLEQIRVDENFLNEKGIELVFVPYSQGISTSELIKKIQNLPK